MISKPISTRVPTFSWGPTVAYRVPVHASGPSEKVPHYRALTRAVHTHLVPAGAFRGFGIRKQRSPKSSSTMSWPSEWVGTRIWRL